MKVLGIEGENVAVKFLEKKGYRIIRRNYKTHIGEIDIIAQDGNTIVFVEVRQEAMNHSANPLRQ
jgi:putative endonuclease